MPDRSWVETQVVQRVEKFSAVVMQSTVWVVFLSGYALSALVFVRWAIFSFGTVLTHQYEDPKQFMHTLLLSIELLILMPVPAIVGIVSYRTISRLGIGAATNLEESQHQVGLAEHLLIGLLVIVTGTTLLDLLITSQGTWLGYAGGAIHIAALSLFLWVSKQH